MTPKLLVLIVAAIGITPAVLWSLVSLVTSIISVFFRLVSLSFRLYSKTGGSVGAFEYHELPVVTSLSIVAGAALVIFCIASISRTH